MFMIAQRNGGDGRHGEIFCSNKVQWKEFLIESFVRENNSKDQNSVRQFNSVA